MYEHERSLVKTFEGKFTIVGVNSDPREKLNSLRKDGTILWDSFWDGGSTGGPIATKWNVSGWPTLYLLDQKGVIRHIGLRGDSLEKAIEELVAEAG
ncbi:hypothetical protein N8813_00880 [bacterium]|nr:hypothetical protein [bacterium]MDC0276328.1 hypothetical protein [Verrucomicrobiales bacterium]